MNDVTFSAGALSIVAGLLSGVVGGLVFLHRALLASMEGRAQRAEAREAELVKIVGQNADSLRAIGRFIDQFVVKSVRSGAAREVTDDGSNPEFRVRRDS